MSEKVVLAYSGGLDTSVAIKWIQETYGMEVIALMVDVGSERDLPKIQKKALKVGAIKSLVADAKEEFVKHYVFPALKANALYEGQYSLATALARPLIVKLMVDVARKEGAKAVAHGCTGKGNDQVRFDVSTFALAPDLRIIAPAREWGMTREEEVAYAKKNGIPVSAGSEYSIDINLWGRSIECGVLEDPWNEPPDDIYILTRSVEDAPDEPAYVEIGFDKGEPVSLYGQELDGVSLIHQMTQLAGSHGIGRVDHVENRLVGIKSREIYEAPAATVLLAAHRALEALVLSKEQLRFKERVSLDYADMVYNGLWFTPYHEDLKAYVESTQRHVSGTVRLKLHKGKATVVGRKSPYSLYRLSLATYEEGDEFDQSASVGFIQIWGLPAKTQAQVQGVESLEGKKGKKKQGR
jgi:argininosuccinate synthase